MKDTNRNDENVVKLSSYFTIKPRKEEMEFIRFEYEASRRARMSRGCAPQSLSRFLTRMIIEGLKIRGNKNG